MKAAYQITIGGTDVSDKFAPLLISLILTDADGGKADTLEIELDDTGGHIALPAKGADITALIWWAEPPPGASSGALKFQGKTDEVRSRGSREHGRTLAIMARSTDGLGKGKHKQHAHKDKASFSAVAKQWGGAAGLTVKVHPDLAAIQRDYWIIPHESFLSWGRRIADELGATFKVSHPNAAFVPRNASTSAGGAALPAVKAVWGQNLISWDITPTQTAGAWASAQTHWYDHTKAKWNAETASVGGQAGGKATHKHTFKHADKASAHARTSANINSARRLQAGVSVMINGDAAALSQATLNVGGARPGVDGAYQIKTARHALDRNGGWTTTCDAEQPSGAAGKDSR